MALYRVEAVVLHGRDYGEGGRILTLFTRERGRVDALAKGVRRPGSSLAAAVQPFSHSRLLLWEGRSLDGVREAEVIDGFAALQENLVPMAAASYIGELVREFVQEEEPQEGLYRRLLDTFRRLAAYDEAEPGRHGGVLLLLHFTLHLLEGAGYGPRLAGCVVCGRRVVHPEGRGHRPIKGLDPVAGGMVCADCPAGRELVPIAPRTLLALLRLRAVAAEDLSRLSLDGETLGEVDACLQGLVRSHLDRKLRSRDFLDTVLEL